MDIKNDLKDIACSHKKCCHRNQNSRKLGTKLNSMGEPWKETIGPEFGPQHCQKISDRNL